MANPEVKASPDVKTCVSIHHDTNETKNILLSDLVDIALSTLKESQSVHFSFGEISCKVYFSVKRVTYTVDFDFIARTMALADQKGIAVYRKDEYSTGCNIGDDYDITGVTLTTIKFRTALDAYLEGN